MTRREALEILGLDSDASLDDARNAYRKLARIYHPDKNSAPNATAMFRKIHDAYEFIRNNNVYQQTETATQQRQTEAEAAQKRAEDEFARRHAERKRAKEAHHRAKEEATQKAEKKAKWKKFRNCCIALFPINLVLTSLTMVYWPDGTVILREGSPLYLTLPLSLFGFSINSLGLYLAGRSALGTQACKIVHTATRHSSEKSSINTGFRGVLPMYDIFGCASDFAHNFRHLMPTTLNCGVTTWHSM